MMNKQPFEELVGRHGATVYRVCRALVGPSDADDAWSETFLAALRAYPELPVEANTEAWLVRIAHHRSIDVLRARARRPVPAGSLPEAPEVTQIDGAEGADELWTAVAALPARQRQAVAYHYLGRRPYAEVAELIGGTAAAARRASADGIARLRQRFGEQTRKERS
jgi:RNA polymerase sigma factor (sigma-70 family)